MKMKLIYLFAIYSVIIAWYGCTGDHNDYSIEKSAPIRFGSVIVNHDLSITRTMGADEHNIGLPMGSDIDVFIYDSSGNPVPSDDENNSNPPVTLPIVYTTVEAPDAVTTQSGLNIKDASLKSPRYPTTKLAYIFAVWPAMASQSDAASDNYNFTVNTDQRYASNVTSSDLLSTDKIEQTSDGTATIDLPMMHCMAKVIVKFNPTGSLTDSNMPDEFSVLGVKNSVTIKPKTAATSSGRGAITTNAGTTNLSCSSEEAFLIPPQTIAAGATFLQFDIKGSASDNFSAITGVTFKPAAAITFEANTVYEITVNVNVNYITATATIMPWNTEEITFEKRIL